MTFTTSTSTYLNTKAAKAVKADIRRRAMARYTDRVQSGYADGILDFSDLVRELLDAEAA